MLAPSNYQNKNPPLPGIYLSKIYLKLYRHTKAPDSALPLIWIAWLTSSETVNHGWMFDKDTGVKGGETLAWGISEFWVVSRGLEIFIAIALKLLDGMEKLRDTTWEGVGSGDAEFDTNDLPLGCMWPLGANSDEWTAKGLEDFGVELDGGLGSSWSSLILGEDTKVGEAVGDTLGDTLGEEGSCTVGFWKRDPENDPGGSVETGFVGHDLLGIGPEKENLLIFLESNLEIKSPSAKGGGNWVEAVFLLLFLSTECAFLTVDPQNLSSPVNFSHFFCSRGDECHKLCPLKPVFKFWWTWLPVAVVFELFGSTGVGSTYVLSLLEDDGCICFNLSAGSDLFSAKRGADWLIFLFSPLKEKDFSYLLSRLSCTHAQQKNKSHCYRNLNVKNCFNALYQVS